MAEVNASFGAKAISDLETEFGADKAILAICDVTKKEQVEGEMPFAKITGVF